MNLPSSAVRCSSFTPDARPGGSRRVRVRDGKALAIGFALLALYILQDALALKLPVVEAWQTTEAYKITTGALLLAFILGQWRLSLARARRDTRAAKVLCSSHISVGLIAPALLFAHATSFGHGYLTALAGTFLATYALGITNRVYLDLKSQRFWHYWMIAHVTLSTLLLLLVTFHIYVVFH